MHWPLYVLSFLQLTRTLLCRGGSQRTVYYSAGSLRKVPTNVDISFPDPEPSTDEKFGCPFSDEFKYTLPGEKLEPPYPKNPAPVWGNPMTEDWAFDKFEDFTLVYNKMEDIRRKVLESCIVNTINPFISAFGYFKNNYEHTDFNDLDDQFRPFFEEHYKPVYPKKRHSANYISCLLRFFDDFSKDYPKVKKHFVLSSGDMDVSHKSVKIILASEGQIPPKTFENKHVAGIISILVENTKGYVVIDFGLRLDISPVIMVQSDHQAHNVEVKSTRGPLTFSLNGEYIQARNSKDAPESNTIMLFYASKSICSFVISVEKSLLLTPTVEIAKFNEIGSYEAFCKVNLGTTKGTIVLFLKETIRTPQSFSLDYLDVLSEDEKKTMKELSRILELGETGLLETLANLRSIRREYYDYYESFVEMCRSSRKLPLSPRKGEEIRFSKNNETGNVALLHAGKVKV